MPNKLAKISKLKKLSPVWIFPIVTVLIGIWVLYIHFSEQGKNFILITSDASGIVAGKTVIKSRNVEVGKVEKVVLSGDLKQVIIKGTIDKNMTGILKKDSIFWVVKPQVDIEGISGLSTLLSGVYIGVMSGTGANVGSDHKYHLLDSAPVSSLNTEGVHVNLVAKNTAVVSKGAPVLFRGFRVGNVEKAQFDVRDKNMKYQIFIARPYDSLITKNVRFWREGGFNLDLSTKGARLDIPSLDILLSGGISFDVPAGMPFDTAEKEQHVSEITFQIYPDKESIQNDKYTQYDEFLLFFSESIAGLAEGDPVEYRGIRLGSVARVPYFSNEISLISLEKFTVPVLINIEPQRLAELNKHINISQLIVSEQKKGLRASIKSSNLLTGSMYIDLDFYSGFADQKTTLPAKIDGYKTIATVPSDLLQFREKLFQTLDNFNKLPLEKTANELNRMIASINNIVSSKEMQSVPNDLRQSLNSLQQIFKSVQPGSDINQALQSNLEKFEWVLDQLLPVLRTLNKKSNALIFAAPTRPDPEPKAKGNVK